MTEIKSFAKINLTLKVSKPSKFKNGYHKIKSTFLLVDDLFDLISIDTNSVMEVKFANYDIHNINNSVYKTMMYLKNNLKLKQNYLIKIKKNIPPGSGLGGPSSNAIAVANHFLKKLKPSKKLKHLKKIAKLVGYDCYFFIKGFKSAEVSGYGEKVKQIYSSIKILKNQIILNKDICCETKKVYQKFDSIKGWENNNDPNMLERACKVLYPELSKFSKDYRMSGSGSSFFKIVY